MNESCSVEFSEVEKPQESKSVFIYLTVGFIVILLISLSYTVYYVDLPKKAQVRPTK
jgi:uncharacterized membrane protein YukC